ncbi:MAG: phosphonate metabolism transcriptional regulator PhnF [Pseudomonadota bacterium]
MPATPIWKSIASTLRDEIAQGLYAPGDKLPTEAALAARFDVNRHTVRHALAALAEDGLTHARRGAGVYVLARPTLYPLSKRVRFHQNLAAAGIRGEKQLLRRETRPGSPVECANLALEPGAKVHVAEGVALADGTPVSHYVTIFPADRLPGFLEALSERASVTHALGVCGVSDFTRARTELTAVQATPTQALHLRMQEGAPLLRSIAINVDPEGVPVEFGTAYFVGERVSLTLGETEV